MTTAVQTSRQSLTRRIVAVTAALAWATAPARQGRAGVPTAAGRPGRPCGAFRRPRSCSRHPVGPVVIGSPRGARAPPVARRQPRRRVVTWLFAAWTGAGPELTVAAPPSLCGPPAPRRTARSDPRAGVGPVSVHPLLAAARRPARGAGKHLGRPAGRCARPQILPSPLVLAVCRLVAAGAAGCRPAPSPQPGTRATGRAPDPRGERGPHRLARPLGAPT